MNERGHAVNAGVTGTYNANGLSLLGKFKSLPGTVTLAFHACVNALGSRLDILLNKSEIVFVSHNNVAVTQCLGYGRCYIGLTSRSNTGHKYLTVLHFS